MSGSIRLSPKHGINPSLAVCFFCQKDRGDIILPGLMKGDTEAPRRAVWDKEPCEECKGYMSQGIIFISVDAHKSADQDNPYRSGGWCVLREDAVKRILKHGDMLPAVLKSRVAFIPDEVWNSIGLPR